MDKNTEIVEGNRLIAEFMGCYGSTMWAANEEVFRYGFKDTHITERWHESEFSTHTPYHTSWDWLMPVVERVNHNPKEIDISTEGSGCYLVISGENRVMKWLIKDHQMIQCVWMAVIEAIKWYNTQSKTNQ